MKELETIVDRLEKGDVELEASILIYERGEALKTHCDGLLRKAEARVEKISLNQNGQPTGTEPLDVRRLEHRHFEPEPVLRAERYAGERHGLFALRQLESARAASNVARIALPSTMAKVAPMQVLGPAPNGI